jgi:hypothetical protein
MATPDTHSQFPHDETHEASPATRNQGIVERWSMRRADRRFARLLSPRSRRALAQALRATADDTSDRNRRGLDAGATARWCWSPLLHYRTAAVRTELLEIAALLEHASDPDPACVQEIHELLTNGNSPLYHRSVHVSELYATLYYLRARLLAEQASHPGQSDPTVGPRRHLNARKARRRTRTSDDARA